MLKLQPLLFFLLSYEQVAVQKNVKAEVEPHRKRNGGQEMVEPSIFYPRTQ